MNSSFLSEVKWPELKAVVVVKEPEEFKPTKEDSNGSIDEDDESINEAAKKTFNERLLVHVIHFSLLLLLCFVLIVFDYCRPKLNWII